MYNKYKGPKAEIENQSLDQAIKAKQGGGISLLNAAYYIVAYCASGAIVSGSSYVETMDVAATRATVSCGHDVPTPDRRCPGRSLNVCRALVNAIPVQKTNQAKRQPPTPIWLLLYTQPTPVLAHLSSRKAPRQDQPNTPPPQPTMPAHRHSSTARSHAQGPYKASIIVISSDEEEEPVSVPKRAPRKPRRSIPEGEVLEILDDPPIKFEEQDTEDLRRRCRDLEQVCSTPLHPSIHPTLRCPNF
jgi:hypothetical protein